MTINSNSFILTLKIDKAYSDWEVTEQNKLFKNRKNALA